MAYSYDPATQAMPGHYVEFTGAQGEYHTMPFRYVWPSELDLMAQLAGMRLRDRWDGWSRQPFTGESSTSRSDGGRAAGSPSARTTPASSSTR